MLFINIEGNFVGYFIHYGPD